MKIFKGVNKTPVLFFAGLLFFGCSKSENTQTRIYVPTVTGPVIDAGSIPSGSGKAVKLSNDTEIFVQNREGKLVFEVEGAFSVQAFSQISASALHKPENERAQYYGNELQKVVAKLGQVKGIELYEAPEIGYFTFEMPYEPDLMGSLKRLQLDHSVVMEPVAYHPEILQDVKAMNPMSEGFVPRALSSRESNAGFSGLERIHAPEFVKLAEADIGGGAQVNGSSVIVGVTDTGITLNHPSFLSQDGKNRIVYMRDFTREGRVYFNPSAKFEIKVPMGSPPEVLFLTAEIIPTPKVPNVPAGDRLVELKDLAIKVSPELREILTKPGSGAKLGILDEDSISSKEEPVDINADGKSTSKIPIILIPGAKPQDDQIYVDLSGTMDFRNVKPIGDWNKTHVTLTSFAEELGFDMREDALPSSLGADKVTVRSVSLVGFDPGNHGTHVSGIIAGIRTIDNDQKDTLARGVAPEAKLAVNRVCTNNAGCNAAAAFIDLAARGVDVINMSLGGLTALNDGFGMQEMLINRLTAVKNVLFVISAGNSGPGRQTVGSPSVSSLALSVGATATRGMIQRQYQWPGLGASSGVAPSSSSVSSEVSDQDDFLLFFSSRGPSAAGGFKPNLTAPGTELSAIQLNSAPGIHAGLAVYWGTSMAAPAAAGAYALFLDAIKKYNIQNPKTPLTTDAVKLREILIQSARPFDVSRLDTATGEKLVGQYTWIDEGLGMLDLVAAWKKIKEVRDQALPTAVNYSGIPIDLDYEVIVPMTSPSGASYDGTRVGGPGVPAFGKGVYLSYSGTETFRQVSIGRRLPMVLTLSPLAGVLTRQLRTTQDEFVMKTLIFGSDKNWLKVGALDQLNCAASETANLTLLGEGATIQVAENGTGKLAPQPSGSLNLCLDREMIRTLDAGDHGALISGYRLVNGVAEVLPSFTVPVYLTVPHHTLAYSTAYDVQQTVKSFSVRRNYVTIPKGTTLVRMSLEVPELKRTPEGLMEKGETCSGVEFMPLVGNNTAKHFKSRLEGRVSNCDALGGYTDEKIKRKLTVTIQNPKPGIWDLPVFGSYKYAQSKYHLRVDYMTSTASIKEIKGGLDALKGRMRLNLQESSLDLSPSPTKSGIEINSLMSQSAAQVKNMDSLFVPGQGGVLRSYAAGLKKVTITTGGSPGNDLDLYVMECPKAAQDPMDPACTQVAISDGPTDEESATFEPKADKVYAVRVLGSNIKDEGKFLLSEVLTFAPEKGTLSITPVGQGAFDIDYLISPEQLASSAIVGGELFSTGKYTLLGTLTLKAEDDTVLYALPVTISSTVPMN